MAPNDGQARCGSDHRFGCGTVRQARVIQVNDDISVRATCVVDEHASSHNMQVADALVAATALHLDMPLVTGSHRHYWDVMGRGLDVVPVVTMIGLAAPSGEVGFPGESP